MEKRLPTKSTASQAAEKSFFEGAGLQAVHKRLKTGPALAAEGTAFALYSTFFRKLFSRAATGRIDEGFSPEGTLWAAPGMTKEREAFRWKVDAGPSGTFQLSSVTSFYKASTYRR